MALYEIRQRREIEELRPFYWRGIRTFITSTGGVSDAHNLQGEDFPGSFPEHKAGTSAPPQCSKTRIIYDPGGVVGLAMVFAFYESTGVGFGRTYTRDISEKFKRKFTAGNEGVYERRTSTADGAPAKDKDNGTSTVTVDDAIFLSDDAGECVTFKATGNSYVVSSYTSTKVVVVTGDASGEADEDTIYIGSITSVIEGFEQDGVHEWQVVKGNNVTSRTHMLLRVDTSYADVSVSYTDWTNAWNRVSTDEVSLPAFRAIKAGKVWFIGSTTSRERFGDIVDASLFFLASKDGWATEVESLKGVWVPIQQPLHDAAEALVTPAQTRAKLVYLPGKQLNAATGAIEATGGAATKAVTLTAALNGLVSGLTAW